MAVDVRRRLTDAGCIAADAEAAELAAAAAVGGVDLEALVDRRVAGEPLAWITGRTRFCGLDVRVDPGVYVPRPHTEALAVAAATALPAGGTAVDLCTGTGAIAMVLALRGRVVATDVDERAVANARANGVDARVGDLDGPLPGWLLGRVDVLTAVPPYVPTEALPLLPRDTLAFEPLRALDGGAGGTVLLQRVVDLATRWLRPGGSLFLEVGAGQRDVAGPLELVDVLVDEEGDDRALVLSRPLASSP